MKKEFSFSRAFLFFIGVSMVTMLTLTYILVSPEIRSSITDLQKKEINEKMNLAVDYLEQYINTQVTTTNEIANLPIVKNGVMQSLLSIQNLQDTISTYKIGNKRTNIIIVDILGDVITEKHSLGERYNKHLQELHLKELLQEKAKVKVDIIKKNQISFLQVAVPISYKGSVEGILITQTFFNLSDIFSFIQEEGALFELTINNESLQSSFKKDIDYLTVSKTLFNFELAFLTPTSFLEKQKNKLIFNIGGSIFTSISIAFLILFFLGRKVILNPYDVLEETVKQRTADLEIIQKIATIANSSDSKEAIIEQTISEMNETFGFYAAYLIHEDEKILSSWHSNEQTRDLHNVFMLYKFPFFKILTKYNHISTISSFKEEEINQKLQHHQIKNCTFMPITAYNRTSAILIFFSKNNKEEQTFDEQLMLTLSNQLSRVLERAKIQESLEAEVVYRTKELSEIRERLDLAFKGAGDGAWDWNIKTNDAFYSNRFKELLGYKSHEFDATIAELRNKIHPEDKKAVIEAFESHLKRKIPFDMQFRIETSNEGWRWFRGRGQALWDEHGEAYRMAGSIQDIENLKEKEGKLELFAQIIKNTNDLVVVTEADNISWPNGPKVIFVNDAFCKFTGYSFDEVVGGTPRMLQGKNTDKKTVSEISKALNNNKPFKGEILNYTKDGEPYWIELNIMPILFKHGKPTYFAAIERDITDRKNAEKKLTEYADELEMKQFFLEQSKEEAEHANKMKSEFLAVMSHEIRTPMNGIIGMSELLLDTPLEETQKTYVKKVIHSSDILLDLINDILDFSKIESGKIEIENRNFNLKDTVENIVGLVKTKCKENVELKLKYLTKQTFIHGDMVRISQVITNLLGNAAKFTEKGHIELIIQDLDYTEEEAQIKFSITDTGVGISEKAQETIFDTFTQADSSITRKFGGTGLGLSISQKLVELMGGTLELTSELGKGSTFYFTLTSKKVTTEEEKPENLQETTVEKPQNKILIVDDNKINRQILSAMLKKLDIKYDIAEDGLQAVKMNKENYYHLIFMDIQMPNMDGIQATKEIRNSIQKNDVTIIALTANALKGDAETYLEAGMNDYLSKPFKKKDIINMLNKWS